MKIIDVYVSCFDYRRTVCTLNMRLNFRRREVPNRPGFYYIDNTDAGYCLDRPERSSTYLYIEAEKLNGS